jgi:hypothetical protein
MERRASQAPERKSSQQDRSSSKDAKASEEQKTSLNKMEEIKKDMREQYAEIQKAKAKKTLRIGPEPDAKKRDLR